MRPSRRAAFDLCLYLGLPHPDYLLGMLTSRQWGEWLLYLRNFPLPHDRADINTALARADIRGAAGARAKAKDLIPPYGRRRQPKSEDEMKAAVSAWAARSKGTHGTVH